MKYNSDFAWDLAVGQMAERKLAHILEEEKIEVKVDRFAYVTGNIAVEYECRGKPSGIAITKASYWCFAIHSANNELIAHIIVDTKRLKKVSRKFYRKGNVKSVGDKGVSRVVLIPLVHLFMV
jgi:hypothetical protein